MCKELEEYVKESEKKGKILTYINLIEKGALNVDEAARYADMSVKALKKEAKRLGASLWLVRQNIVAVILNKSL